MQNPFKKKKDGGTDTVVVLKRTGRNMCGGTDATQDTRAPKEILSEDMRPYMAAMKRKSMDWKNQGRFPTSV